MGKSIRVSLKNVADFFQEKSFYLLLNKLTKLTKLTKTNKTILLQQCIAKLTNITDNDNYNDIVNVNGNVNVNENGK